VIEWYFSYLSVSSMLYVVVVPANCSVLKNFVDDHFAIFAEDLSILYKLS